VLTTSRDNTLRIWDGAKGLAERVSIRHNNNTGRWISPLRAVWSPAADAVICGNMGRMVRSLTAHSFALVPPRELPAPLCCPNPAACGKQRNHNVYIKLIRRTANQVAGWWPTHT
jgi:hypothetical protein